MQKLLTLIKQKGNLEQDLITITVHISPIEKIKKYRSTVFMNVTGNTVKMRLTIGSSH